MQQTEIRTATCIGAITGLLEAPLRAGVIQGNPLRPNTHHAQVRTASRITRVACDFEKFRRLARRRWDAHTRLKQASEVATSARLT